MSTKDNSKKSSSLELALQVQLLRFIAHAQTWSRWCMRACNPAVNSPSPPTWTTIQVFLEGSWAELMEKFKAQAERFGTRFFEAVERWISNQWPTTFKAGSEEGWAQTIVIASGASREVLGPPNEIRLQGYGVSACATCDGFFYRDQVVAVVGGGLAAGDLFDQFASKVYLLVRRDQMRASKIMQHRVEANEKVEILWNTEVLDVLGDDAVTGIRIVNNQTKEERDLELTGFFLAIGHKPNSDAFEEWLTTDETGYIITKPDSTATDYPGVFACGDVQDHVYRQAITAAGSGCMAALEAERWLEEKLHS